MVTEIDIDDFGAVNNTHGHQVALYESKRMGKNCVSVKQ